MATCSPRILPSGSSLPWDPATEAVTDANRNCTLTHEQSLELFYATFEDWRDGELCEPCAEAVLDAWRDENRNAARQPARRSEGRLQTSAT